MIVENKLFHTLLKNFLEGELEMKEEDIDLTIIIEVIGLKIV